MGQILNVSIDLSKIPEGKIVTTDASGNPFKNGQKFVKLTIFVNDHKDTYGKDVKITLSKEKESKEQTLYIGDGRKFQTDDLG